MELEKPLCIPNKFNQEHWCCIILQCTNNSEKFSLFEDMIHGFR